MFKGIDHPKFKFYFFGSHHYTLWWGSGDMLWSTEVEEFNREKEFHLIPIKWKPMVAIYPNIKRKQTSKKPNFSSDFFCSVIQVSGIQFDKKKVTLIPFFFTKTSTLAS